MTEWAVAITYAPVRPSVRPSIGPSVRPSVCPSEQLKDYRTLDDRNKRLNTDLKAARGQT